MKDLRCDACGKSLKSSSDLNEIKKQYETDEVKEVCDECMREIDNAIVRINDYLFQIKQTQVQRFVNFLKERVSLETKTNKGSDK